MPWGWCTVENDPDTDSSCFISVYEDFKLKFPSETPPMGPQQGEIKWTKTNTQRRWGFRFKFCSKVHNYTQLSSKKVRIWSLFNLIYAGTYVFPRSSRVRN